MTNPMTTNMLRRRRLVAAQSLTVAIIVLFLLLFLGGLFIALIVNNLRNIREAGKGLGSEKLAEAGIAYLDDQLTKSPEGADWRPLPFVADPLDVDANGNYDDTDSNGNGRRNAEPLRTNDPDFEWLKPCGLGVIEPCGYSRVDFGGKNPSSGNGGGRALVKVIYQPDPVGVVGSPSSKYLKLVSVGRVGIVDPLDPTTFANSEGKGLRREKTAHKAIGLVEYLLHITNKNDRPTVAALGAPNKVLDTPQATGARPTAAPEPREVESVYHGPIHSNAPLTFFGVNRLLLDGTRRGDALTVAANLSLSGVDSQTTTQNAADPTRVFLTDVSGAVSNGAILPSGSPNFSDFGGLVRDNTPQSANNLRRIAKTQAPLMDLPIGDNGLTRYRALTRDAEPLNSNFVVANPIAGLGATYAARIGWGAGLYFDNREDLQNASESLLGAYSPRANWTGADPRWWNGDNRYVPPAVVVTLTPRYMIIQRSATSVNRSFLRDNTGRRINQMTVVRFSGLGTGAADIAPRAGLPDNLRKLEGYPATPVTGQPNVWSSDYVVFAEGNIRIRGVAGGLDPETQRYYIRHLTFVSNGNIYVDGNLLKDNLSDTEVGTGAFVRGKSSIALLAKNYVVLNTTQFLTPGDNVADREAPGADATAVFLKPDSPQFNLRLQQGPVQTYDAAGRPAQRLAPAAYYGGGLEYAPAIFLRHSAAGIDGSTAVRLGINADFFRFPVDLAWPNSNPVQTTLAMGGPTSTEAGVYFNSVFALKDAVAPNGNPAHLYPDVTAPFSAASAFGMDNLMSLSMDTSAGVPNQTNYRLSRVGVAPLDIRVEALMYAQEGSFFIIPGPWFNPDPNDTYENYLQRQARSGDNLTSGRGRIDPSFPFYGQPMDIRITLFGAITENLPAEVGDQGAWLEKWGWVPQYYGSTGLPSASGYASQGPARLTLHGPNGVLPGPKPTIAGESAAATAKRGGSGIVYHYDETLVSPYAPGTTTPLRTDEFGNMLPAAPRLPVAPGLLYSGETPQV